MRIPAQRSLNRELMTERGQEVVRFEVLPTTAGERFQVSIENVTGEWRQGVWLGTEGLLRVGEFTSSQVVLWHDNSAKAVEVEVLETDGLLRLYNVWDSGRGLAEYEWQSATSGKLVEQVDPGTRRYRCNDIGSNPAFDKVVFTLVRGIT